MRAPALPNAVVFTLAVALVSRADPGEGKPKPKPLTSKELSGIWRGEKHGMTIEVIFRRPEFRGSEDDADFGIRTRALQPTCYPYGCSTVTEDGKVCDSSSRHRVARTRLSVLQQPAIAPMPFRFRGVSVQLADVWQLSLNASTTCRCLIAGKMRAARDVSGNAKAIRRGRPRGHLGVAYRDPNEANARSIALVP